MIRLIDPPTTLSLFLMILPPPRSTLFPYTTLFRSIQFQTLPQFPAQKTRAELPRPFQAYSIHQDPGHLRIIRRRIDRKSTRLNSSHANISYAVFCLKKKIITSKLDKVKTNNHTLQN